MKNLLNTLALVSVAMLLVLFNGSKISAQDDDLAGILLFQQNGIGQISWNHDSTFLSSADEDGLSIFDIDSGDLVAVFPQQTIAHTWNPDGTAIAGYSLSENELHIFDVDDETPTRTINAPAWIPESQNFVFTNELYWNECGLYSLNGSISIHLWDVFSDEPVQITFEGHADVVTNASMNSNCKYVTTSSADGTVRVWDTFNGNSVHVLQGRRASDWNSTGTELIYITTDQELSIIDIESGENSANVFTLDKAIFDVEWHSDEDKVVISDNSNLVMMNIISNSSVNLANNFGGYFDEIHWSPDGTMLAARDNNGLIIVFQFS